ncbi:haloacetate dehalogenase [Roseibium aquae]|uniref:Haloacetate dehalogenase n=1 Tax=Roseibium aquae TaxID=1323746 RepID=A0A916X2E7_9HYPH|nr:alpha/beta hydrolase [Roseibium aquae]GGB52459.1 haloacetate dehalogenase [Roseibium aquae]
MDKEPADLFPGFDTRHIATDLTDIHCRIGGSGPPMLLLHGYPQTHAMWHLVAPALAEHFTLVLADLPGYGKSGIPPLGADHEAYSKRTMAAAMVTAMDRLGFGRFHLAGHDRGGRVAYRLALDHPQCVEKIAVIDILPTYDYWARLDRAFALRIYHWAFLAQPAPFPETLIGASMIPFLEHTLASWTGAKSLTAFAPSALDHYRTAFRAPGRIAASCEDYRAGAGIDVEHDAQDRASGNKIEAPLRVLWGTTGIAQSGDTPLSAWKNWASDCSGTGLTGGHFLPEENPNDVITDLLTFFR